jgi:hypothetical protein
MKLHHPAVQFDLQSIGTHGKFYDVGMFTLVRQLLSPITFKHVTLGWVAVALALTPSTKIIDVPIANALM